MLIIFLVDFKNDLRVIYTPYSADVLENCILTSDSVDVTFDSNKLQCKLCPKRVVKKKMRNHVGFHIIHKAVFNDSHRCGYCGNVGCIIQLVTTSGFGKSATQCPKSDCPYFTDISNRADNKLVKSQTVFPNSIFQAYVYEFFKQWLSCIYF